jgi:erythromycin esterase-like protein
MRGAGDYVDTVGFKVSDGDLEVEEAVGFYGLDLHSLYTSVAEVIAYLERIDPPAAQRARERYACFAHFGGEQTYGRAVSLGISRVMPPRCRRPAHRAAAKRRRLSPPPLGAGRAAGDLSHGVVRGVRVRP